MGASLATLHRPWASRTPCQSSGHDAYLAPVITFPRQLYLGDEVEGCDLEDVPPQGHAVHLAQQVLDGHGLRVLAQHLEGVALGAHILLAGQHLRGIFWVCSYR